MGIVPCSRSLGRKFILQCPKNYNLLICCPRKIFLEFADTVIIVDKYKRIRGKNEKTQIIQALNFKTKKFGIKIQHKGDKGCKRI